MKFVIWILFILAFVWIVSVVVAIVNPTTIFGPIAIVFSIIGAILILTIVEILR